MAGVGKIKRKKEKGGRQEKKQTKLYQPRTINSYSAMPVAHLLSCVDYSI